MYKKVTIFSLNIFAFKIFKIFKQKHSKNLKFYLKESPEMYWKTCIYIFCIYIYYEYLNEKECQEIHNN